MKKASVFKCDIEHTLTHLDDYHKVRALMALSWRRVLDSDAEGS